MSQKSKSSLSLSLKNYKSSEILWAVIIILLAVIIPRYVKLPTNVELLFKDRIGQLLLLLLAVMIGSYNFLCGVLMVVLFLSIMINISSVNTEGFENEGEGESDVVDADEEIIEESESFEDEETFADKKTKPTKPPKPTVKPTVKPTIKPTVKPTIKQTVKPTVKPTTKLAKTKKPIEEDVEEDQDQPQEETSDEMEMETDNKKSMAENNNESVEEEPEDETIEGFNCGCDSNDRRAKLINYARADQVDPSLSGLFEKFENPPQSKSVVTPNPFDVAGCRYDLKESNPLHETIYGAPVDSCMAYQSANVAGTGTVFYPLNAF